MENCATENCAVPRDRLIRQEHTGEVSAVARAAALSSSRMMGGQDRDGKCSG